MKSVSAVMNARKAAIHTTTQPYKVEVDIIKSLLTSTLTDHIPAHVNILIRKAKADGNDLEVLYPELMSELRAGKYV